MNILLVHLCIAYSVPLLWKCLVRGSRRAVRSYPACPALPAVLAPAAGKGIVPLPGAAGCDSRDHIGGRGRQGQQWTQGTKGARQSPAESKSWQQQKEDGFSSNGGELTVGRTSSKITAAPVEKQEEVACLWGCSRQGRDFI